MPSLHSTTKPKTSLATYPSVANFPALKHAFNFDGVNLPNNTITCLVTEIVVTFVQIDDQGNSTFAVDALASTTMSGTLEDPGTTNMLLILTHKTMGSAAQVFQFGDPDSTFGVGVSAGASTFVTATSGAFHTHVANTVAAVPVDNACVACSVDWAGNEVLKYYKDPALEATEIVTAVPSGNINGGIPNIPVRIKLPAGAQQKTRGAYVFMFANGLPPSTVIQDAVAWMAENDGIYEGLGDYS